MAVGIEYDFSRSFQLGDTVPETMLAQGLELAVFGMGTVFVFLTLLILATRVMSALVLRHRARRAGLLDAPESTAAHRDAAELTVIASALHRHRKKRQ